MSDRSVEDRSSRHDANAAACRDSNNRPSRRGGRRPGAGRKPGRYRSDAKHRRRPELVPGKPVHVTLRLRACIQEMRTRRLYHVFRKILGLYLSWPNFHIVHISIQRNHLHLIIEATNRGALTKGMQSFAIRCARALHRDAGTRGKVFAYRYHSVQITTPRQARNCLAYVLNNWRRHHLDVTRKGIMKCPIDPYSSALSFDGWSQRIDVQMPDGYVPLPVSPPQSELLRTDYQRFGLIDPYECPGPMR
jgi:REP element-mobilizing transposase RayT